MLISVGLAHRSHSRLFSYPKCHQISLVFFEAFLNIFNVSMLFHVFVLVGSVRRLEVLIRNKILKILKS